MKQPLPISVEIIDVVSPEEVVNTWQGNPTFFSEREKQCSVFIGIMLFVQKKYSSQSLNSITSWEFRSRLHTPCRELGQEKGQMHYIGFFTPCCLPSPSEFLKVLESLAGFSVTLDASWEEFYCRGKSTDFKRRWNSWSDWWLILKLDCEDFSLIGKYVPGSLNMNAKLLNVELIWQRICRTYIVSNKMCCFL